MKVIQLYSGGIDSFIGYHYLKHQGYDVMPIYYNLNHRYVKEELDLIRKTLPFVYIDETLQFLGKYESDDAHIPFRNLFLLLRTALEFEFMDDTIYIVQNSVFDDRVSDSNKEFLQEMEQLLNKHSRKAKFKIISPFPEKWTKFDAVDWYKEQKLDLNKLDTHTFSCYSPVEGQHCYNCQACFRRNTVLYYAGIKKPFYNKDIALKYLNSLSTATYPKKRRKAMGEYLSWLFSYGPLAEDSSYEET